MNSEDFKFLHEQKLYKDKIYKKYKPISDIELARKIYFTTIPFHTETTDVRKLFKQIKYSCSSKKK